MATSAAAARALARRALAGGRTAAATPWLATTAPSATTTGSAAAAAAGWQLMQRRNVTYMPTPGDSTTRKVTLIPGDGIGPEVTTAVKRVVAAMNAPIEWEVFNLSGRAEDVPGEVLASIKRNRVCLKGTLFTPLDEKNTSTQSMNVQIRKSLNLYANLVHVHNIPGLKTRHDNVDIVIIRENTEGEYSGLEHEVVPDVVESLKVITETASLRIAEYAFEYAFMNNRKKVTAVHKANIMKLCDGLFLECCRKIAKRYPHIKYEEMIVDNTCMQLVSKPEQFDVMVTPNLYGSLVTNVGAGLAGGPGLMPGGNVGMGVAVFEQGARHVAKDIAGQNKANPTALLLSAAMMFRYLKLDSFSDRLERAVIKVISENRGRTRDLGGYTTTTEFTDLVIDELAL